jgi:hypothetical protein
MTSARGMQVSFDRDLRRRAYKPSCAPTRPATERELCLRLGDRQGPDGAGVHEVVGAVCFELDKANSRNAMLVELNSVGVVRNAFGRADAGIRIDDHVYGHDGVLSGVCRD